MAENQTIGTGGEKRSVVTRELLSRRVIGFVTLFVVFLPVLSFGLILWGGAHHVRSEEGNWMFLALAVWAGPLACLCWGLMILRNCSRWACWCIVEGLLMLGLLGMPG
jgi:hypothetical protein